MKSNKELIDEIADILYRSDKYVQGGVSVCDTGLKSKEYPLVYKCGDIELKVSIISRYKAYVSTYVKGNSELASSWVLYEDIPVKTLREIHKIVKNYFKK